MQDQHKQLPPLLPSLVLSGPTTPQTLVQAVSLLQSGVLKVLFMSPEKVFSSLFRTLLQSTSLARRVRLLVVDEAHCISSWSYNFRADYLRINRVLRAIREANASCTLLALTATGGSRIRDDIGEQLTLPPAALVDCGWRRSEVKRCAVWGSQPPLCQRWALAADSNADCCWRTWSRRS